MDKSQKQLVDTYLRKREIASGEYSYGKYGERGGIKPYELLYMIKNKTANLKKIDGHNVAELVKYDPNLYYDEDIKPYLSKISSGSKSNIIRSRPEFMDIFDKSDIDALDGSSIANILIKQPQLVDRFDLSKLKLNNVITILEEQPQFINKFQSYLKMFDKYDKSRLWFGMQGTTTVDYNSPEYGMRHDKFLNAIVKYPLYREFLKDELKTEKYIVVDFLKRDYSLLPYFNLKIISGFSLYKLLGEFPKLIDKVDKYELKSIDYSETKRLLQAHPELKPYFDNANENG